MKWPGRRGYAHRDDPARHPPCSWLVKHDGERLGQPTGYRHRVGDRAWAGAAGGATTSGSHHHTARTDPIGQALSNQLGRVLRTRWAASVMFARAVLTSS